MPGRLGSSGLMDEAEPTELAATEAAPLELGAAEAVGLTGIGGGAGLVWAGPEMTRLSIVGEVDVV